MGCDFLVHPVCDAWEHSGSTRQHDVAVQVFPDVHITLHDGVECSVINALSLHAHQAWGKQDLGAPEPFAANGDDLHIEAMRMSAKQHFNVVDDNLRRMHSNISYSATMQELQLDILQVVDALVSIYVQQNGCQSHLTRCQVWRKDLAIR